MHFIPAATLAVLASLALLATSPFSGGRAGHGAAVVSAALTPDERLQVEAKDPDNPNYCPACLKKAMNNHFPHACPEDLEPMEATTRPEGPLPHEKRCVCVSFVDLYWMKLDCEHECTFVNDPDAMSHFLSSEKIPGCDKWVDFSTGEERDVETFEKKDPGHVPEVFVKEAKEQSGQESDKGSRDVEKESERRDEL